MRHAFKMMLASAAALGALALPLGSAAFAQSHHGGGGGYHGGGGGGYHGGGAYGGGGYRGGGYRGGGSGYRSEGYRGGGYRGGERHEDRGDYRGGRAYYGGSYGGYYGWAPEVVVPDYYYDPGYYCDPYDPYSACSYYYDY